MCSVLPLLGTWQWEVSARSKGIQSKLQNLPASKSHVPRWVPYWVRTEHKTPLPCTKHDLTMSLKDCWNPPAIQNSNKIAVRWSTWVMWQSYDLHLPPHGWLCPWALGPQDAPAGPIASPEREQNLMRKHMTLQTQLNNQLTIFLTPISSPSLLGAPLGSSGSSICKQTLHTLDSQ